MSNQSEHRRYSNLELLRILCIIFIIMRHYYSQSNWGDGFGTVDAWNWQTLFVQLIGSLGYAANNIFILITGYFMIEKQVRWRRIVSLIAEMFFYSWIIILVLYLTKVIPFTLEQTVKAAFPIWFGYNWFVCCYVIFCCFLPFINQFLNKIDKETYKKFLAVSILLLHIAGTFRAVNYLGDSCSIDHFFVVYSLGGYIKKYGIRLKKYSWRTLFFLSLSLLLLSVAVLNVTGVLIKKDDFIDHALFFTSGSSFLSVMTMTFLFLWIINSVPFYNRLINSMSRSVVGIFLIHNNPLLHKIIWNKVFPNANYISSNLLPIQCILKIFAVFFVCLIIDQLRLLTIDKAFQKFPDKNGETIGTKLKVFGKKIASHIPFG